MSGSVLRPPVLASAILRLFLPKGVVGDTIRGDLWQEFNQRARSGSRLSARTWYWRHILGLAGRSLLARVRARREEGTHGIGMKGAGFADDLAIDVRYGARQLARRPAFTFMIVLTLAVGIGPSVAIFSILKGLVLRQLPYPEPARVVAVWETEVNDRSYMPLTAPDYFEFRDGNGSFEELGVYEPYVFNFSDGSEPIRVQGVACTASALRALQMEPAWGRLFTDAEETRGEHRVVILGNGFWKRQFAADPRVIGMQVTINGDPYDVIGVMPESFEFVSGYGGTARHDVYLPLVLSRGEELRGRHWLLALGRLAPGVPADAAEADLRAIATRLAREHPNTNARTQVWVDPLLRASLGGVSRTLVFLLVMVSVLLLLACANVAAMLLARGTYRMTELAVRATLGAGRRRLVRQLLTESLLLSLLGGSVAVLVSVWSLGILKNLIPGSIPRIEGISIDGTVLLFALVITSFTGVAFGLTPALFASRADLAGALKDGLGVDTGWRSRKRSLRFLMALQLGIALALVNSAALLAISYRNVISTPLGFAGEQVLLASVYTDGAAYATGESRLAFWTDLTERVEGLPGVEVAAATTKLPLRGGNNGFAIAVDAPYDPEARGVWIEYSWVLPGYIEAMRIPLLEGRTLRQIDQDLASTAPGAELQVVINRTLAERFWPENSAIGKQFRQNGTPPRWVGTVVGVVDDVRQFGLERVPIAEVYFPYAPITRRPTYLVARTSGDPAALVPTVREIVHAIDPNLAVTATSMGDILAAVTERRRFSLLLVSLFAGTALLLVAAGTYGIMSYSMSQRAHEIGVRAALGAGRRRLLIEFLGNGLRFASWGLGLGVVMALWAAVVTANQVYGVNPFNPLLILGGAAFVFLVAVVAILVPVKRASRADPIQALRSE